MQERDVSFSKLAVTRFSHDLAGVVSAVSNSLSLLSEIGGADKETLALASDNAEILMGRLRFFRAAFGNEGPLTDIGVTQRMLEDYLHTLENRSVHFSCSWQTDSELPIFAFRLILLGGQVAAESLLRGGEIMIEAKAGDKKIRIEAKGKTVPADPALENILNGETNGVVSPKTMPALFLLACLKEQNWDVSFSGNENGIVLSLGKKQ